MLTKTFYFPNGHYLFDGRNLDIYEIREDEKIPEFNFSDSHQDTNYFLRTIVLNLTYSCNLKCSYCYANQGAYCQPGISMSYETARQAIDLLFESVRKNSGNTMRIVFFGGEPLLSYQLIIDIVKYVTQKNIDNYEIQYLMTTNGTLIKEAQAIFFKKNKFQIMVSIDGDKITHDSCRIYANGEGSYHDTVCAVELMIKKEIPLEGRITIANNNTDILKSVKHLRKIGLKRITFATDYNLSRSGFDNFLKSLSLLASYYLYSIQNADYFDISNFTAPISSIVTKSKKIFHCSAGLSYLSVGADGLIYRCPRFTDNKLFQIGRVGKNSFDIVSREIDKFSQIVKHGAHERTLECSECPYIFLCGGNCYHHSFTKTGKEFNVISPECKCKHLIYDNAIKILCLLNPKTSRDFLNFLSGSWQTKGGE